MRLKIRINLFSTLLAIFVSETIYFALEGSIANETLLIVYAVLPGALFGALANFLLVRPLPNDDDLSYLHGLINKDIKGVGEAIAKQSTDLTTLDEKSKKVGELLEKHEQEHGSANHSEEDCLKIQNQIDELSEEIEVFKAGHDETAQKNRRQKSVFASLGYLS